MRLTRRQVAFAILMLTCAPLRAQTDAARELKQFPPGKALAFHHIRRDAPPTRKHRGLEVGIRFIDLRLEPRALFFGDRSAGYTDALELPCGEEFDLQPGLLEGLALVQHRHQHADGTNARARRGEDRVRLRSDPVGRAAHLPILDREQLRLRRLRQVLREKFSAAQRTEHRCVRLRRDEPRLIVQVIVLMCWLILIHLTEIAVWGLFYFWQGCMPDAWTGFYFSAVTYTGFGDAQLVLPGPWRMLGPLEAMTGTLMYGLSTGLFFALVSRWHSNWVKRQTATQPHAAAPSGTKP